ncbi:MAG: repressor LexA [Anaerolineales bacterium]|nr:repressor LexA [Anaerolineales bacterium]
MARKRSSALSERQKKILQVLQYFQDKFGYPPSIREICDQAKVSSTSVVNYYLDQLEEMGYIERDSRVSRGIRLVGASSGLIKIPLAGRIAAGAPLPVPSSDFSLFEPESMVDIASSLLPSRERTNDLFALEVQGDSMIDAMVYDGDIVVMKPAKDAHNGEMVAVWLNDREETTLKYFYLENGRVRLQPANPTMKPIYIDDPSTVEIQGKVVMVIRQVQGLVA